MNIRNEILKIAKTILAAYPISQKADFWSSVYLSSFPGMLWRTEEIDENRFRNLTREFMTKLEQLIKTLENKKYFYSHLQWKINVNHSVNSTVTIEEKGRKERIDLYFGSEGNEAGKVYVDGQYQAGQGKTMMEIAEEIIRVYKQINEH